MYQLNNSVTFIGKSMGSEEFLIQMVETLGITIIDRHPKGRPCKMESQTIKNRMCFPLLINKIEGEEEK